MKAEHRHELKTNELADWLTHIPEWTKENSRVLIGGGAIVVIGLAIYYWSSYNRNVRLPQQRLRLTGLISSVEAAKIATLRNSMEEQNIMPLALSQPIEDLGTFAEQAGNTTMAASAYLQRAKALRAEVHLRNPASGIGESQQQVQLARESYLKAKELSGNDMSLRAAAEYGLGLCAEEEGSYGEARKIYTAIVGNPDLEGTAAWAAAQYRLELLPRLQTPIAFRPAPPAPVAQTPDDITMPAPNPTEDIVSNALAPILDTNSPIPATDEQDMNGTTN